MMPLLAPVISQQQLADGICSFWLHCPAVAKAIQPGQFVSISTPPNLLRRPFSVAEVRDDNIRLVIRVVGTGTARLAQSRKGDQWDLLGPLGKAVPQYKRQQLIIVGGGIGIAPLLFLVQRTAHDNGVTVLLGARNKRELILLREFRASPVRLGLATEDGSQGRKGLVTDLLESELSSINEPVTIFACGPRPMLARVKELAGSHPAYGFWEERMGCGTGICYGCAVRQAGTSSYLRFCQEGPVLNLTEIDLGTTQNQSNHGKKRNHQ